MDDCVSTCDMVLQVMSEVSDLTGLILNDGLHHVRLADRVHVIRHRVAAAVRVAAELPPSPLGGGCVLHVVLVADESGRILVIVARHRRCHRRHGGHQFPALVVVMVVIMVVTMYTCIMCTITECSTTWCLGTCQGDRGDRGDMRLEAVATARMRVLYEREVPLRARWGVPDPNWSDIIRSKLDDLCVSVSDDRLRKALRDLALYRAHK